MEQKDNTLPAFGILTVILSTLIFFGADVTGAAGVIVSLVVGAVIALLIIGGWAIGQNLSK